MAHPQPGRRRGRVLGIEGRVTNWFYPNTYRAFALPFQQSFRRAVFGIPPKGLGRDVVYDPARPEACCSATTSTRAISCSSAGAARKSSPTTTTREYIGTIGYSSPILGQTTSPPAAPWKIAQIRLDVYAIK